MYQMYNDNKVNQSFYQGQGGDHFFGKKNRFDLKYKKGGETVP